MFEIYDLVLNYCNAKERLYEFYEWNKKDQLTYINKIPLIKINSFQLNEILTNIIRIEGNTLLAIKNKTTTEIGIIPYSVLITDSNKVIALKFNNEGLLIERSGLLLDEELAVIEESKNINFEIINYEIISSLEKELFLTREDKKIRSILLERITNLYKSKSYDELDYLYQEINNDKVSIKKEYEFLIAELTDNYNHQYHKLYDIIKLTVDNKKIV